MSHTSTVKSIKITSITALRAAVEALVASGVVCSLKENATPRAFYSNQVGLGKADYVLELGGAPYDVGFYKTAQGDFEARTDFWGGHVEKILGAPARTPEAKEQARMGKLFQQYGLAAAKDAARKKGLMTRTVTREDGTIALVCTGPSL